MFTLPPLEEHNTFIAQTIRLWERGSKESLSDSDLQAVVDGNDSITLFVHHKGGRRNLTNWPRPHSARSFAGRSGYRRETKLP